MSPTNICYMCTMSHIPLKFSIFSLSMKIQKEQLRLHSNSNEHKVSIITIYCIYRITIYCCIINLFFWSGGTSMYLFVKRKLALANIIFPAGVGADVSCWTHPIGSVKFNSVTPGWNPSEYQVSKRETLNSHYHCQSNWTVLGWKAKGLAQFSACEWAYIISMNRIVCV